MGLDTPAKSYKTVAFSLKRASTPTGSVLPPTNVLFACRFKSNFHLQGRERGTWALGARPLLEGLLCFVCKTKCALNTMSQEEESDGGLEMKFPACGWTQPSVSKSSPRTFIVPRPGCLHLETPWVRTGHPGSRVAACTNRAGVGWGGAGYPSLTPSLVSAVTGGFVTYDVSPPSLASVPEDSLNKRSCKFQSF